MSSRRSGVLLHPTSLPGPFGRGDLGPAAHAFVDQLAAAGQRVWQVLPLGPPGWGGSPYAAASAFAGDGLLVSLEQLVEEGWLDAADLEREFPEGRVDVEAESWRRELLAKAADRFEEAASAEQRAELDAFAAAQADWLDDYAVFAGCKAAHGGGAWWTCFPAALARREPAALEAARAKHAVAIRREVVAQFFFERQWRALRERARAKGVAILGDLPIFVARDSADLWANPALFDLNADGSPRVVAGVPPDEFTEDGQLWGNPLYAMAEHASSGYRWWIDRFRRCFDLVDEVRVDHFRGFASYYEIPADAETAREGRWVDGLGLPLFEAVARGLGKTAPAELAVVAEDLGFITPDVEELLAATGFPGMKILQFAFYDDDAEHPFKVANHPTGCVVYTGTHDNQTTAGWLADLDAASLARVHAEVGEQGVWGLIELGLSSKADLAVTPVQDLLELDDAARLNSPGTVEGNWTWRLLPGQLTEAVLARLRALTEAHGRA